VGKPKQRQPQLLAESDFDADFRTEIYAEAKDATDALSWAKVVSRKTKAKRKKAAQRALVTGVLAPKNRLPPPPAGQLAVR